MAEGLNKVMLIGNLGQEPELRTTQSGTPILSMRLATNERWKDQSGEWKDRTEWHTVIVWGKRGEALNKILAKGRSVYVEGRLQTRSWEVDDGSKRYATEVVANNVLLLGGRGDNQGRDDGAESYKSEPRGSRYDGDDSDIPF